MGLWVIFTSCMYGISRVKPNMLFEPCVFRSTTPCSANDKYQPHLSTYTGKAQIGEIQRASFDPLVLLLLQAHHGRLDQKEYVALKTTSVLPWEYCPQRPHPSQRHGHKLDLTSTRTLPSLFANVEKSKWFHSGALSPRVPGESGRRARS